TPFSDATQTAAAVARPAASSSGTNWTETTPNTKPLSDMTRAKSTMATERARPCRGGSSLGNTEGRASRGRVFLGHRRGARRRGRVVERFAAREANPVQRQTHRQVDTREEPVRSAASDAITQSV